MKIISQCPAPRLVACHVIGALPEKTGIWRQSHGRGSAGDAGFASIIAAKKPAKPIAWRRERLMLDLITAQPPPWTVLNRGLAPKLNKPLNDRAQIGILGCEDRLDSDLMQSRG